MTFEEWCWFTLRASGPIAVLAAASALILILILKSADAELTLLDGGNAPESSARLIAIGVVLMSVIAAAAVVGTAIFRSVGASTVQCTDSIVDRLSLVALVALGAAFTALDTSFNIADSMEPVAIALLLVCVAVVPCFLGRARRLRGRLGTIAATGLFMGWIAVQQQIDWNMRRPFLRAFSKIQTGMSAEQVEAVMRQEFPGKRPVARIDHWVMQYTLDPDDGRFNSEFIVIDMSAGKVISTQYVPD